MYKKPKISKRESPDKGLFTVLNHSSYIREQWANEDFYIVLSIDPATNNFAMRVEQWWLKGPQKGSIKPIIFTRMDFRGDDGFGSNLVYQRVGSFILDHAKYIKMCHYIVSERQLPINYKAVRISTYALAFIHYILISVEFPSYPAIIIEVDPWLKSKQLNAPKSLNSKQLKEWSIEKGIEILEARGDTWSLGILEATRKKKIKLDDLTDTIVQVEALFKLIEFIPKVDPKIKPIKIKQEIDRSVLDTNIMNEFILSETVTSKTSHIIIKPITPISIKTSTSINQPEKGKIKINIKSNK